MASRNKRRNKKMNIKEHVIPVGDMPREVQERISRSMEAGLDALVNYSLEQCGIIDIRYSL